LTVLRTIRRFLRPLKRATLSARDRFRWGPRYGRLTDNLDHRQHLDAAVDWLCRAQDAGSDRGVSYGAVFGGDFQVSYPETTGYIIPTVLNLARILNQPSYRQRAIEMGDWEIAVQMSSGAVMGGKVNPNPTPAVFNTGQVLLGWSALFRETGAGRFLEAARGASDWLMNMQDPDGNWTRGNSDFANPKATLYNVKAAWGLAEAGKAGVGEEAVAAAVRNAEYCLTKQTANGWFADCCLADPSRPLLHTLAYTLQGLIGIGRLVDQPKYWQAAEKTARSLIRLMDAEGFIPGQIDADFRGRCSWCCLTGTAQTSIVWSELFALTGDEAYRTARRTANRYLMQRHNLTSSEPAIRGGVFGSWPVWGAYGYLMVLNWATKFFIDALVLEMQQEGLLPQVSPGAELNAPLTQ
jgi:uncharacterized protein YyaL (SSP411 family)